MLTLTYERPLLIRQLKEARAKAELKAITENARLEKLVEKCLRAIVKESEAELAAFLKGESQQAIYVDGRYWYPPHDPRRFDGSKWDNAIRMLDLASDSEIKITSARGETLFDLL